MHNLGHFLGVAVLADEGKASRCHVLYRFLIPARLRLACHANSLIQDLLSYISTSRAIATGLGTAYFDMSSLYSPHSAAFDYSKTLSINAQLSAQVMTMEIKPSQVCFHRPFRRDIGHTNIVVKFLGDIRIIDLERRCGLTSKSTN